MACFGTICQVFLFLGKTQTKYYKNAFTLISLAALEGGKTAECVFVINSRRKCQFNVWNFSGCWPISLNSEAPQVGKVSCQIVHLAAQSVGNLFLIAPAGASLKNATQVSSHNGLSEATAVQITSLRARKKLKS